MLLEHCFRSGDHEQNPVLLNSRSKLQDTQRFPVRDQSPRKQRWLMVAVTSLSVAWFLTGAIDRSWAVEVSQLEPSATEFTVPSLWWVKDQFTAKEPSINKLIQSWSASPSTTTVPGRVDYKVNRQLWSLLDYLERYTFLNDFGAAARDFGYNIRILDGQNATLAAYTCDFSTINLEELRQLRSQPPSRVSKPSPEIPDVSLNKQLAALPCQILLESSGGKGSLRRSTPSDAGAARFPGTD